jgi:hypothetical protein
MQLIKQANKSTCMNRLKIYLILQKKQDIHKENTNATLYMNNFITLSYKAHAFEHTTKTSPSPDFDTHAVILRPS